ncbi:MAG: hypothetical protein ISR65_14025 [Bacteriovoracaceae bacterium]|nr:hypothetical protein [Bacteriovoracaceae bacterium]
MNLKDFIKDNQKISKRSLKEVPTSSTEIMDLFAIANRDYEDAINSKKISLDTQFGIIYNAAFKALYYCFTIRRI